MCKVEKFDDTRLKQAYIESLQSKCVKHSVGCIITNKDGRIVASGYNGTPAGDHNCIDQFPNFKEEVAELESKKCNGEMTLNEQAKLTHLYEQHHKWSAEHEIHAEMNALLHSNRDDIQGGTLYCTHQPCADCSKNIANSGISRVVYGVPYGRTSETTKSLMHRNVSYVYKEGVLEEINGKVKLK
jgi:dCMP deaminase